MSAAAASSTTDLRPSGTLLATGFGTALTLVAFTMPLGLLGSIVRDLGAGASGRTWILSSMSVGLAGALLVAGSLADDLGRRRVFLAGLSLFAAGSLLGALAASVAVLAVARAAQGVGGAALLAGSLALIAHEYPPGPGRAHATGIWGATLGVGIAIGPIAGALIAELGDWHTAYAVLAGVSAAAYVPLARRLTESRAEVIRSLDLVGAALLALGLIAITAGVVQGNTAGWGSTMVVALGLAGIATLALFAMHELRRVAPLFDVRLLAHGPFVAALAGSFALGFTVLSFMSYEMTFTQLTLSTPPVTAALWGATWAVVSVIVAMRARVLGRFLTPRTQVTAGLGLCAAGMVAMLGLRADSSVVHLVPGFLVMGIGTGMLNAALAQAAVSVVPPSRAGMGAGANNTARYLGAGLGVALVVGLLHSGTERRAGNVLRDLVDPATASLVAPADVAPLAAQMADGAQPSGPGLSEGLFDFVARASATDAMNRVIVVIAVIAAAFAVLCFVLMRPARAPDALRSDEPDPTPTEAAA